LDLFSSRMVAITAVNDVTTLIIISTDPPPVPAEDEIAKALNAIGVTYRHQNDAILQPSRVEELKAKKAKQVSRSLSLFVGLWLSGDAGVASEG
jgi:hypothetical protein